MADMQHDLVISSTEDGRVLVMCTCDAELDSDATYTIARLDSLIVIHMQEVLRTLFEERFGKVTPEIVEEYVNAYIKRN